MPRLLASLADRGSPSSQLFPGQQEAIQASEANYKLRQKHWAEVFAFSNRNKRLYELKSRPFGHSYSHESWLHKRRIRRTPQSQCTWPHSENHHLCASARLLASSQLLWPDNTKDCQKTVLKHQCQGGITTTAIGSWAMSGPPPSACSFLLFIYFLKDQNCRTLLENSLRPSKRIQEGHWATSNPTSLGREARSRGCYALQQHMTV